MKKNFWQYWKNKYPTTAPVSVDHILIITIQQPKHSEKLYMEFSELLVQEYVQAR